jgi:short-subunit dehydrogenase
MNLRNKVIAVTGAGSGIGRELARQLLIKGARVAAIDYNEKTLNETLEQLKAEHLGVDGEISLHVADVSNREQVSALPQLVVAAHGHVDGLINNAGIIHPFARAADLPLEAIERVFNINWWGVVYLVKVFLPLLKDRPEAHIANVSSMGGYMPFPGQVIYGSSKAAVKLFTEGLMVELKDTSVRLSVVYPGAVQSNITDNAPDISSHTKSTMKSKSQGKAVGVTSAKAAADMIAGIEKNKPRILIGQDCKFIDKLYRLMPVKTPYLMTWIMNKAAGGDFVEMSNNH